MSPVLSAERGQGLDDGTGVVLRDARAVHEPLPPLRGGEGARKRGEGAATRDPLLRSKAIRIEDETLKGVALETELLDRGVLNIQCKAEDADGVPEEILYFGSIDKKKARSRPALAVTGLREVLQSPPFNASNSALRRFVALQGTLLRGEWRSPSPTEASA